MIFRRGTKLSVGDVVGLIEGTRTHRDVEFDVETRRNALVINFLSMSTLTSGIIFFVFIIATSGM